MELSNKPNNSDIESKCCFALIFSICAFVFSLLLMFPCLPRTLSCKELQFDYIGAIVGILSLLVTVLIGWQILNYFQMENRIEKLVNVKINSFAEDYKNVMDGIIRMNIYNNAMSGGCAFLVDNCFDGLQKIKKCSNPHLNDFAIANIMELLNNVLNEYSNNLEIYESSKDTYLYEIKVIDSKYKENIEKKIKLAKEIPYIKKRINTTDPISEEEIDKNF